MATSSTVGRLHLLCTPHFYDDRSCYGCMHRTQARYNLLSLSSFFPQRSFVGTFSFGKLACKCFRSSSENMLGRVDTPVDAGINVSHVVESISSDILDISYRENNRVLPPAAPCYSDEDGPTEFDFEIYASNTMANYKPLPPPTIPFCAPFEDYYGEAIGVDYISREEKPANSLLRLLDSLNTKKVEDGGETTTNHLFTSGSSHLADVADEKPLFPESTGQHIAEGIDGGQNMQEIINGSGPRNVSTLVNTNAEENAPSSSIVSMEEVSEQPSISSQVTMYEATSADGKSLSAQNAQHAVPPTVVVTNESQDIHRSSSFQAVQQEQPTDSRSSGDLKRRTSPLFGAADKTQVKDSSQFCTHAESRSASVSRWTGPPDDVSDAHTPTLSQHKSTHQIKGNLRQTGYNHTMNESRSWENAEVPELCVNQVHGVASADTGRESLPFKQALESSKETLSMLLFYVPQEGDLVVGAVTFINDQKVDLEIGAELSALMPIRDLQPLLPDDGSMFFEIPSEDGLSVPFGESLLVKEKSALNSFSRNGMVDIGTIVVAEVIAKTIIDGRAILSCKSAAQKLAWHRIDQLMRLDEAVKVKIMQWNEGGLLGAFEGVRAFIPRTELLQRLESTALLRNYVGRTLSVAVVQIDRRTSNIIASEVKAWMSKNLQLGTVHDVTVTKIHTYGMQVEIDNTKIRGFVHKTNFSKEYASSAMNSFAEGDKARVMLIKGRDPTKVSFSLADLEKENGLLLRDKEQVFREAEEMGRRFRERLSEQERRLYGVTSSEISLDYQDPKIANLAWLRLQTAVL